MLPTLVRKFELLCLLAATATICLWAEFSLQAELAAQEVASQPNLADQLSSADHEYFEKKVRPLLHEHCYECHSAESKVLKGGLRLDVRNGLLQGGDTGPAVIPGKPEESLLIQTLHYDEDNYQMPPQGKLPEAVIAELTAWVARGAPFPVTEEAALNKSTEIDFAKGKEFWSFQPLKKHDSPAVQHQDWPRRGIDPFVLAKMEQAGLSPTAEADRRVLLRRLTLDLTGLPPTPEQIKSFLVDDSPQAYEKLVENLLASPHYGERWGRLWLDLARYTDQTEVWLDQTAHAYLYRDWVVQALNADVPYDQFIRRQLATDMMPETGPEDLAALGFLGLSPAYWKELKLAPEVIKVIVADEWEERVDAVSRTFLGLTVACARCHDHKFDPISTEDYYALAGVMASSRMTVKALLPQEEFEPIRDARKEVENLTKELEKLRKQKPPAEEKIKELETKIESIKTSTPNYDAPTANVVADQSIHVMSAGTSSQAGTRLDYRPEPRDLHLFIRGNPNRLGALVPRRFLTVLSTSESKPFTQGSGRLELADAIVNDASALTARVIVNRIWLAHFGQGLVNSPSNFGQLGSRPSHPELLDDLAGRFIENGWSLKWLHREIVLSATYRQASTHHAEHHKIDPDNRWLWRMNRKRLEVEAWRDAMLQAAGKLDLTLGGPSVSLANSGNQRRTIYGTIHRRDIADLLSLYDFPDANSHSPQRINTSTPLQGLYVLNSPFMMKQAAALASRVKTEVPGDLSEQIKRLYLILFARPATQEEIELAKIFLSPEGNPATDSLWLQYAHALLGSNEFIFVD